MIHLTHKSNSFLATLVFGLFLSCASAAWGADISHYATGLENGTTGMNKGNCASIAVSTDAPRTGAKCISTIYTGGTGETIPPQTSYDVETLHKHRELGNLFLLLTSSIVITSKRKILE